MPFFSSLSLPKTKYPTLKSEMRTDQTCRSGEFTCGNGRCIMEKWRCDRDDDCGDGSDEMNCSKNQCDSIKQFQCADNICVPAKWRCDGELDCNDGSDERVSDAAHCVKSNGILLLYVVLLPNSQKLSRRFSV